MINTAFELDLFNVVLLIALALIFARVLGYLFDKLKQPAVIGEIVAGIILGGIGSLAFFGQDFSILNFRFHFRFSHLDSGSYGSFHA